jgi:hypothetical protein
MNLKDIERNIFENYNETRFKNLKKEEIDALLKNLLKYLTSKKPPVTKKQLRSMGDFLVNLSLDDCLLFYKKMRKIDKKSEDFKYLTYIHENLLKLHNHYKIDVYDTLACLCRKNYEAHQKVMKENRKKQEMKEKLNEIQR